MTYKTNLDSLCLDCNIDTIRDGHYYMVKDEVWLQTGLTKTGGMLCVSCLELRIGKELDFSDFSDLPINTSHLIYRSEKLISRLENYEQN